MAARFPEVFDVADDSSVAVVDRFAKVSGASRPVFGSRSTGAEAKLGVCERKDIEAATEHAICRVCVGVDVEIDRQARQPDFQLARDAWRYRADAESNYRAEKA